MPEFVMEGRDHAARAESDFVLGFIEALFFTNTDSMFCAAEWFTPEAIDARENGQSSELPCDVGYCDIHPETLTAIRLHCKIWQKQNRKLLARAYERDYDETQAGRDLWYTSQGHGVGFWDRKELESRGLGEALTTAAGQRDLNPFFGQYVIHGDAPFVYIYGI